VTGSADPPAGVLDPAELFQHAPAGYLVTDDDGAVLAVNETFLRWSGHARADLLGRAFASLLPIGDRILWSTTCGPQLAFTGSIAEQVVEIVGADAQRRAALLSAVRTPADGDRPATVRIVLVNAHERRAYELQLVTALRRAEESEAHRGRMEAQMRHLALHDSLTGLLNRAGLTAALGLDSAPTGAAELRHRWDGGGRETVLFIDLDHFKAVNDSLGHAAGDKLLVVVAERLRAVVRAGAVLARLAGDEFVVVDRLPGAAAVEALAERLQRALNAPLAIEGLELVVSASIGAAIATGEDDDPARLLRHADFAMYRAKSRGRNGWAMHETEQDDAALDRLRLLGELRAGIDRGELRLHYQPRVAVRGGELVGVEALVRWQHPTRGLLAPGEFIPVAEESGLVRELGDWVLDAAVAQATRWCTEPGGPGPLEMAVNLSARQLADPRLLDRVTDALARHGLPAELLVLEITETALMVDPDAVLGTLRRLKELGVGLAVDDFGTGFSSLVYLKQFPVDELKIDRSFVAGLGTDPGDLAIVTSCIQLAHGVGVRAVAEGVETPEQEQALAALGCDLGQGFLWSPGLPADELAAWSADRAAAAQPTRADADRV